MPGTLGACVDRVQKVKFSSQKERYLLLHLIQNEILTVRIQFRAKPEQKQQNLSSFAKYKLKEKRW
jgi:hypothetical protein